MLKCTSEIKDKNTNQNASMHHAKARNFDEVLAQNWRKARAKFGAILPKPPAFPNSILLAKPQKGAIQWKPYTRIFLSFM